MMSKIQNDFINKPSLVQHVEWHKRLGQPLPMSIYEEAISKHPEYFPKEVELRRKWDSVPIHIIEAYKRECLDVTEKVFANLPPQKGFLYWSEHKEEYLAFNDSFSKCMAEEKKLHKEIYDKYLTPYGL